MTTLILSTWAMPASRALAAEARRRGWNAISLEDNAAPRIAGEMVFYGSLLVAMDVAAQFNLALLEPPLDILARLPRALSLRQIEFTRWCDLGRFSAARFLKPADPLAKVFDAGIYRDRNEVRVTKPFPGQTPVLAAEPVEWLAEFRCFVLDGKVVAASPYLSFGRPLQHQPGKTIGPPPLPVLDFCRRLTSTPGINLPLAYVVDVGLIEDRGWAVVEFNPPWCAGILSASPANVLNVLRRSCRDRATASAEDLQWMRRTMKQR
ncbi:MAG TPA: ATP-grasp domain-containing protein [Tepidisphaeraceae bacterium]|jgi:hypothetical protein|nr:ATP-grasp domain-containing protein [Tepidisphaeraceae bacterium]